MESAFRTFKRQRFSPAHRFNVVFVDSDGIAEGAVDDGRPAGHSNHGQHLLLWTRG